MSVPEIIEVPVERALSPTQIDLAEFTANPYKGCGVGCVYCYARSNRSLRKTGREWGSYVMVKKEMVGKMEEELAGKTITGRVLIGSTTEPFQEAEKTYHLSRDTIELLRSRNIPFVLLTKSPDAAKLAERMNYSEMNRVYMTVNSGTVRDLFEKDGAPQPERMKAIGELTRAGVRTVAYISPVFPGLTDMNALAGELSPLACDRLEIRAESYNPKMGNWAELRERLPVNLRAFYDRLHSDREFHREYWDDFKTAAVEQFASRGLKIVVRIEPFDSFYSAGSSHYSSET